MIDEEAQEIDPFHGEALGPDEPAAVEAIPGSDIDRLHLVPEVAAKARELWRQAPDVRFTSGRRDIDQQAHAMAARVLHHRQWIAQTYRSTAAIRALQHWVDAHPGAQTVEAIAAGLAHVMRSLPDAQLQGISRHLTGRAFDVAPHTAPVTAILDLHPRTFLQHEGGLVIWHVDF
jgi:hypothetical protein